MNDLSQTVQKAVQILAVLHEAGEPLLLSEIVAASGFSRTACFRLLTTLEHEGLVARDGDSGRYSIGRRIIEFAGHALGQSALRTKANPVLRELAVQTGDAAMLFVPYGRAALCLDRMEGTSQVRTAGVDIGGKLPLHAGGAPFVLLSFLPEAERETILAQPLPAITARTITDPAAIRRRIIEVQAAGYCIGDQDAIEHVVAIGAPIFGPGGRLLGAVSVGGIKPRYRTARVREVTQRVLSAASRISGTLGGQAPNPR